MAAIDEIRACESCGRQTRDPRLKKAIAPKGTIVRIGKNCVTCHNRLRRGIVPGAASKSRAHGSRVTTKNDERLVLRAIDRECGDDAAEVVAMLGLTREDVPA